MTPGSKIEQRMSRRMPREGDGGGRAEDKSFKTEFASFIIELGDFGEVDSLTVMNLSYIYLFVGPQTPVHTMKKSVAIDVNDLEAQFLRNSNSPHQQKTKSPAFIVGDDDDDDGFEDVIEFNDMEAKPKPLGIPIKKTFTTKAASTNTSNASYASATATTSNTLTVEELEAQLSSGIVISPKTAAAGVTGPPPGLPPGMTPNPSNHRTVDTLTSAINLNLTPSSSLSMMSSIAPMPRNDPNKEFMNRFERNLIMKIHTTQLTTETPLMDDFYYQALSKKKKTDSGTAGPNGQLLYFPLPSAAERQKELQRREKRRKQLKEKVDKGVDGKADKGEVKGDGNSISTSNNSAAPEINADLVLGKVSHSTSRKPRQQLKVPSNLTASEAESHGSSLHEKVVKGIEEVYTAIIAIEDFYLSQEEQLENNLNANAVKDGNCLAALESKANEVLYKEMNLGNDTDKTVTNHVFIHFLTIPKGRAIVSRSLKVLNQEGKEKFLKNLVEYFDFMEIVRPETSLHVIDSFIAQVLSPLVAFVGEADWSVVMDSLTTLFGKRSFVWIALTKSGMVLLCILLSRLEILKGMMTGNELGKEADSSAVMTEKIHDALEGHLIEFFSVSDPSRDFYAWQFLALLAMNIESDRKRSMILELRDKILVIVEEADERAVKNLNVFLNALGLDASQLK